MSSTRPQGKRAARERLAAERAAQAQARRRRERLIRIGAALGVVVVVVVVGVLVQVNRSKVNEGAPRPAGVGAVGGGVTVGTGGPVIDLWEDFQCPICGEFEKTVGPTVNQLVASGKAKVVYHPLSFIGPESVRAANAFGCAADAGKAEQFHNALFANQPAEHTGGYQNADLVRTGESAPVGITGDTFTSCVNDGRYDDWVKQVARSGDDAGVTSTPTVFVAGKELPRDQYTVAGLTAAVRAAGGQ